MRSCIPQSILKRYSLHAEYAIGEKVTNRYISARKHFCVLKDDKVLSWHSRKLDAKAAAMEDARNEYANEIKTNRSKL